MYKNDNLFGGHVIMLGPGNRNAALQAVKAFSGGLQVGGGITPENATDFLNAGASHVIATSYVFKDGAVNWENLTKMVDSISKEKLVLDLSCKVKDRSYYVVTDCWQKYTDCMLTEQNLEQLSGFCDEFLIHAADVEGKQKGIDSDLINLLADISPIPTTYAGGIRSISDLDMIDNCGNDKIDATVGSALDIFGGKLKYRDVVEWHNKHKEKV
jgi:phosphoribosylformimino-5-aminoimidazole carboxamide ribotide isomerase